jgi:hypothetical protein
MHGKWTGVKESTFALIALQQRLLRFAMKALRDAVNIFISVALIAFIGMNLFRLAVFFLHTNPPL